jgi:hypothetical protein
MVGGDFAYYPGSTPLFEGELLLRDVKRLHEESDLPVATRVTVGGDPSRDFEMISEVQHPLRVQHVAYFLRAGESVVRTCNVDLELSTQPSKEIVARSILAADQLLE